MTPHDVAAVMRQLDVRWAVAGGWAIDLWLDRETRAHHDVEIAVARGDQARVRAALVDDWDPFCLDPPGTPWRPWSGEAVVHPAFQLQLRRGRDEFDLFLEDIDVPDDLDGGVWRYRRDHAVHRSADEVIIDTASTIPVVRPEIQLLYMAPSTEPKNRLDFEWAVPRLDGAARDWLVAALRTAHPDHPWIDRLRSAP